MFTLFLLSTSLLLAEPANPEPLPNHPLTISELVAIALANNPESKVAWWHAKRAVSSVDAAKSAYLPKLDLALGAAHGKEYAFINGPNKTFTQTDAELSLSMLLFDFGERSNEVKARQSALEAAKWEADFSLQKVMIHTLEHAYNLLHAQEVLHAARITHGDAKKMLDAAESLQKAGFTSVTDVYTSKATFAEAEMHLAKWTAEVAIRKGRLLQEMGFSADKELSIAPLSQFKPPQKEDVATLIARAKQKRADLAAKAAKLHEAHAMLEKSYVSYLPKLTARVTGGLNHFHHDHTKSGNYSLTLGLNVPLFSGLESIYHSRMAFADTQISLEELARLELAIASEVLSAHKEHEAASDMLGFAQEAAENGLLAYEASLEKYRAGKEHMFQEVSNALQQLALARVRYSEIKTQWLTSLARLAYATGTMESV